MIRSSSFLASVYVTRTHRVTLRCLGLVMIGALGLSGALRAQTSPLNLTPLRSAADTARNAWGRQDYTSYTSVFACDRAVEQMHAEDRRNRAFDTLQYAVEMDTATVRVKTIAQRCGGRFTVDAVPSHQLWALFRVSLAADDMDKAHAIIQRLLTMAPTAGEQGIVLSIAIKLMMNGAPPRVVAARALLPRLDALGDAAQVARVIARTQLLDYWWLSYQVDSLRAYAEAAVRMLAAMPPEARDSVEAIRPFEVLFDIAKVNGDVVQQKQLLEQANSVLSGWHGNAGDVWINSEAQSLATQEAAYGRKTPALQGKFWFNTGGTPRPEAGKLTLFIRQAYENGELSAPLYGLIHKLHARYRDTLEIVIISHTKGWVRGRGPLSIEDETQYATQYFLEFKKLPVGILVEEVSFRKRVDGYLVRQATQTDSLWRGWGNYRMNSVLVDRETAIQWFGGMQNTKDLRYVAAAIDRVIRATKQSSATQIGVPASSSIIRPRNIGCPYTMDTPPTDSVIPPILGSTLRYGMDTTVSPCVDFYRYVNGDWRTRTILGAPSNTMKAIGMFDEAYRQTLQRLQSLLDSMGGIAAATRDPSHVALSAFHTSCMTTDSLEQVLKRGPPTQSVGGDSTRAERCLQRTIAHLSGALGPAFAQRVLVSTARDRMQQLLDALRRAVAARIEHNPWMTGPERALALERVQKLKLRIGIPTETIDYRGLFLSPTDYFRNKTAIAQFDHQQKVNAIGGNLKLQWIAFLLEANAQYDPNDHAIEVPPVVFMPPFFEVQADDAENFAGVGYVIGHEIFHSIAGQLGQIEHPSMTTNIERLKTVQSSLGTLDGWGTDGNRTFSEDVADLGGVLVAYHAWLSIPRKQRIAPSQHRDGFTPEQRFFVAFGRIFRAKWQGTTFNQDIHAAPFARVNGTIMQLREFAKAFGCKEGDPMVLAAERRAEIW